MKKRWFLWLLLSTMTLYSYASEYRYIPMPLDNPSAEWIYYYHYYYYDTSETVYDVMICKPTGETKEMEDGIVYHEISRKGYIGETMIHPEKLYLREEDRRIYMLVDEELSYFLDEQGFCPYENDPFLSKELLLYDFSLESNDEFYFPCMGSIAKIEDIKMIDIVDHQRRSFQYGFSTVLEGIGNLDGYGDLLAPALPMPVCCISDRHTKLCSFSVDGKLVYGSADCMRTIDAVTATIGESQYRLFPSPTTDFIYIVKEGEEAGALQVVLYDAQGKTVFSSLAALYPNRITLPALSHGIYFLRLEDNDGKVLHRQTLTIE